MMLVLRSVRAFLIPVLIAIFSIAFVEGGGCFRNWSGMDGEPPQTYPNLEWASDKTCKKLPVQLALSGTFLPRPAVGYPGTGSTWLLGLITAASGYYSGIIKKHYLEVHRIRDNSSVLEVNWANPQENEKPTIWHVTDPENGRTLLQFSYYNGCNLINQKKSLDYSNKLFKNFGGLLFIRNPWNSFTSFKLATDRTFGKSSLKEDYSTEAMEFARGWVEIAKTWISKSAPNDLLVVQYEKMIQNPRSELVRIMEYLDIPVSHERLDCLEKYPLNVYTQPKTPLSTDTIFYGLNEVNNFLQRSIKDMNKELGERGTVLDYEAPTAFLPDKRPEKEL